MILASLLGTERRARKIAGVHPSSDSAAGMFFGETGVSSSGMTVTEHSAMALSTVWVCASSIASDTAKLPLQQYRRLDRGRSRVSGRVAQLLRRRPNPRMMAMAFRETLTAHCLLWGNGYAEIERNRAGVPIALWPLRPDRMTVETVEGQLRYTYRDAYGRPHELSAFDVFHVHGLSFDGLVGYSVVRVARESMGSALAADRFGAEYFGGGANPGGVIKHPSKLTDAARRNLRESWEQRHQGAGKWNRVAVLEEGMSFDKTTIPPEDSQFLETRQFNVPEICRWFRFPPHKAMDLARATFSNIEHQGLEYVTDCLGAWLVRWEEEAWSKLLSPDEQEADELYFEHVTEALLRGDIKTRYEAYAVGKTNGWLTGDEIRERENLNPFEDGQGELVTVPANLTTPARLAAPPAPPDPSPALDPSVDPAAEDPEDPARAAALFTRSVAGLGAALEAAFRKSLKVEADRLARLKPGDVVAFYDRHRDHLRGELFPIAVAAASSAVAVGVAGPETQLRLGELVGDLSDRHCNESSRTADQHTGWPADRAEQASAAAVRYIIQWILEIAGKEPPPCQPPTPRP